MAGSSSSSSPDTEDIVFYAGANITNATPTLVNIPGLTFDVTPGWYVAEFYPLYNAAIAATGAGFDIGAGTAVHTNATLIAEISSTATVQQSFSSGSTAFNYSATASARTTLNRARVQVHFQVTTAGTMIPRFRSENAGLITLTAGSYVTYRRLT
jgi:hypothetical protein